MSAAGLSATGSASASVYIPGPSSSSRRKSSTVSAMTCHINKNFQHKFYIPGETPSGGPFPEKRKTLAGHSSLTVEPDGGLPPSEQPPQQESPLTTVWTYIRGKVWGFVQNTFKKGMIFPLNPSFLTSIMQSVDLSPVKQEREREREGDQTAAQ